MSKIFRPLFEESFSFDGKKFTLQCNSISLSLSILAVIAITKTVRAIPIGKGKKKVDKQWVCRPPRSLESLFEFSTIHGGQLVFPGYKFTNKEDSMVTVCEHSELTQKRHMYRDKVHRGERNNYRHNETILTAFCPVETCDIISNAACIGGECILKEIGKHSCPIFDPILEANQRYGAHSYQAKIFIPLMLSCLNQGLPMTRGKIINNLMD